MAVYDLDVFKSAPCVFVIGQSQKEFTVHKAIIARQSNALDALINGPMIEASTGRVTFDDVDQDTFTWFCQFAYYGDYTTPSFSYIPASKHLDISPPATISQQDPTVELEDSKVLEQEPEPEPAPEPEEPPEDFGWGLQPRKAEKSKKPSKSAALRRSLNNVTYDTAARRTNLEARCEVRANSDPTENYTPVFLGHAQVYVFAEKYNTEYTIATPRLPDVGTLSRDRWSPFITVGLSNSCTGMMDIK